jgi:hypothetical protein
MHSCRGRVVGALIGAVTSAIALPIVAIVKAAPAPTIAPITVTFAATGPSLQQWTVPFGVTSVQFDVRGAQSGGPGLGGLGGRVAGTLPVVAGVTYDIYVGQRGSAPQGNAGGAGGAGGQGGLRHGGNGGTAQASPSIGGGYGGGGATEVDIHDGMTNSPLIVGAGGGGGGAGAQSTCGGLGAGGCGGSSTGIGASGNPGYIGPSLGGSGGGGSGGNAGGAAGGVFGGSGYTPGMNGTASGVGSGGDGGGGDPAVNGGGGGGGGGFGGGAGGGSSGVMVIGPGGGGAGRGLAPSIAVGVVYSIAPTGGAGVVTFTYVPVPVPAGSTRFVSLSPFRLLDTRKPDDVTAGKPLVPGGGIDVQITGRGGVPATNVAAVVLNVTAADATGPGFVTIWPTAQPRPTSSNLNVTAAGQNIANLATVRLGAGGMVSLYSQSGSHLIADVEGYYEPVDAASAVGRYTALPPKRILDTRASIGVPGAVPIGADTAIDVLVAGQGGVPASGVSAVVLNVTAADAGGAGFVTVWPAGQPRPLASTLNVTFVGQNIPNLVIVPLGTGGRISLYTQAGGHLLADVAGWFGDASQPALFAGLFHPLDPVRILDTRSATGVPTTTSVPPDGTITMTVAGAGGAPASGISAAVLNVTAADATAPGFVTIFPSDQPRPIASNLNVTAVGQNIPNLVSVALSPTGAVSLYAQAGTHLLADLAGYYISG